MTNTADQQDPHWNMPDRVGRFAKHGQELVIGDKTFPLVNSKGTRRQSTMDYVLTISPALSLLELLYLLGALLDPHDLMVKRIHKEAFLRAYAETIT
jgi:hypothetical protein